ncbi:MAG TPA: phycobilisome rod-core linker polypeptide [Kamptonema sp.]|nr:phycobilisome rod-core linker polypeptide [Kamptonema sp.]
MTLQKRVTVNQQASSEERSLLIKQIYQQILERQPYLAERRQLSDLETSFIKGKIGIRHFLKTLAISPLYLKHFYENSSNLKFIENAFKHFLGRSPQNEEEIRASDRLLLRQGVGAMISALVDSEEYRNAFGSFTVPHWRKDKYESPSAYLENQLLGKEHAGQRGWAIPTLYWHELHLDCYAGHCRAVTTSYSRLRS